MKNLRKKSTRPSIGLWSALTKGTGFNELTKTEKAIMTWWTLSFLPLLGSVSSFLCLFLAMLNFIVATYAMVHHVDLPDDGC